MRTELSPRQLDATAAWWLEGSYAGVARRLGITVQNAKNLMLLARQRKNAADNAALVEKVWRQLADCVAEFERITPIGAYHRLRYRFDEEWAARQRRYVAASSRRRRLQHNNGARQVVG